jgi:hypothetical protein
MCSATAVVGARAGSRLQPYLFLFSKDCVHGTARPLLATAGGPAPKRRGRVAPSTDSAEPPAPERHRPGSSGPPDQPADPFAD